MQGASQGFTGVVPASGEVSGQMISLGCFDAKGNSDNAFNYTFKIKNGIFLLSFTIKDLKTGENIVQIFDNEYYIDRTGKVNDYFTDETLFSDAHALEIKDRYGNIAFAIWTDELNRVQVRGYFYGSLCTAFVNGGVQVLLSHDDPHFIMRSEQEAAKLQPKFLGH